MFTYVPGAVAEHYDSQSAQGRRPGSWAPSAIYRGATISTGAEGEPYLTGLPRSDTYWNSMLKYGANAGDALFRGTPQVMWMSKNFGDPLFVPFPKRAVAGERRPHEAGPVRRGGRPRRSLPPL